MTKPSTWFWIAAVVALIWSCMGCAAYMMQMSMGPADLAKLPPAQAEIWGIMPGWVKGAYAVAVWFSLAGSIALLLRRGIARSLYVVSLVAVVVQFGWTFLATPILKTVGPSSAGFPLFIFVAGLAMIWLAGTAKARGWLR